MSVVTEDHLLQIEDGMVTLFFSLHLYPQFVLPAELVYLLPSKLRIKLH